MRLVIGGTPWNETVIIKSLKWYVKAGEPGDIFYDIEFKRFRTAEISTVVTPNAPTDPRDYPTYQGPPHQVGSAAPVGGPNAPDGFFLNPATGQYEPLRPNDPNQGDGTNPDAVNLNPAPGQPGFIGPVPNPSEESHLVRPRDSGAGLQDKPTTKVDTYTIGATNPSGVNWRGQTLSEVYEAIKDRGPNSLDGLTALNRGMAAKNPFAAPKYGPHGEKIDTPAKNNVEDYDPYTDPLPVGVSIKYIRNLTPSEARQQANRTQIQTQRQQAADAGDPWAKLNQWIADNAPK
jgi:hypothetical protein